MNTSPLRSSRRLAIAPVAVALSLGAQAGFSNPYTPPYRGQTNASYAGWESFTSAYLGSNAPDDPASNANAFIVQTTSGAFLPGGNIYSFSSISTFELHLTVPADVQQVALQTSTKGDELNYGTVRLRYVDDQGTPHLLPYAQYTQLAYNSSMGVDVESLFEWDVSQVPGDVTSMVLLFDAAAVSVSLDAVMVDARWITPPAVYCTAQQNSLGCVPAIGFSGEPDAGAASGFVVSASQILDHKSGVFFYGTNGSSQTPYHGGLMCVAAPRRRTPIQNSGGTSACSGVYGFDFNAWMASGADAALVPGVRVWGQYWSRDPAQSSFPSNLTDGLTFEVGY